MLSLSLYEPQEQGDRGAGELVRGWAATAQAGQQQKLLWLTSSGVARGAVWHTYRVLSSPIPAPTVGKAAAENVLMTRGNTHDGHI